jgi:glycine/D-amino acid oxidase-like deaminating enzyme
VLLTASINVTAVEVDSTHHARDLKKGVNLQTCTMVGSISENAGSRTWIVHIERGDITCDTIEHATNAYSAALKPSLRGVITPKPHICNRVVPPRVLSGFNAIKNSNGVLLPDGELFSINSRCSSDGNIMFGGFNPG